MNMMSNALKFTNEGQISVRLSIDDIEPPVTPKDDSTNVNKLGSKVEKSDEGDNSANNLQKNMNLPTPKTYSSLTDTEEVLNPADL